MIECCKENIWYVKRRKKKGKKIFTFLFIVLFIVGFFYYYKYIVSENIINICADSIYAQSIDAMNKSVLKTMQDELNYSDLVKIEKNSNGDISLMSANTYKINQLSRKIVQNIDIILKESLKKGIDIPFLALSGLNLISGYGSPINLKILNISNVTCSFSSKFESVGINQTLHIIYSNLKAEVNIEMPLNRKTTTSETSVLISQAVIVGKVPDIYLNGGLFNNN